MALFDLVAAVFIVGILYLVIDFFRRKGEKEHIKEMKELIAEFKDKKKGE